MRLIRFLAGDGEPRVGILSPHSEGGTGTVTGLRAAGSLGELLALPLAEIRQICASPAGESWPAAEVRLLAPADGRTEVWAAGVTYERSRTARMAESEQSADIYDRVYAAERPELFFKSAAWRVSGPGEPVSVRSDSSIDDHRNLSLLQNDAEIVGVADAGTGADRRAEGHHRGAADVGETPREDGVVGGVGEHHEALVDELLGGFEQLGRVGQERVLVADHLELDPVGGERLAR